jgi:hypothetical protein
LDINLNPGDYILTATHPDTGLMESYNITVLPTLIGTNILGMTFEDGTTYDVTLLDGQGNPFANQTITINIHGVFYNKTTDENGTARLLINLNPGLYIATAYYNDYATSNVVWVKS